MAPEPPTFAQACRFWARLGWISFGGPAGQIAILHSEIVERRRWVDERRFLHALNYCMLLPGPEATQLAVYIGWLLHGVRGGLAAGVLFLLPSILLLWGLSWAYAALGSLPVVAALFAGLKPAVLALITAAALRIAGRVLKTPLHWALAVAALGAIAGLGVPFPAVIGGAALIGYLAGRLKPEPPPEPAAPLPKGSGWRLVGVLAIGLALWALPVGLALAWQGREGVFYQQGVFFSKAAVVTFGGAYAVLPYVSQQAVERFQWLQPGQMMDGLGLAETTPGPLIMVLEFVGFMGGWQNPGALAPWLAGTLGAAMTVWTTFVPSFLFVFLGAPLVERLREHPALSAALAGVTAAVAGVVANLAFWFGWHLLLPGGKGVDWFALAVSALAFTGLVRWRWGVVPVILGSALAGVLWWWVAG